MTRLTILLFQTSLSTVFLQSILRKIPIIYVKNTFVFSGLSQDECGFNKSRKKRASRNCLTAFNHEKCSVGYIYVYFMSDGLPHSTVVHPLQMYFARFTYKNTMNTYTIRLNVNLLTAIATSYFCFIRLWHEGFWFKFQAIQFIVNILFYKVQRFISMLNPDCNFFRTLNAIIETASGVVNGMKFFLCSNMRLCCLHYWCPGRCMYMSVACICRRLYFLYFSTTIFDGEYLLVNMVTNYNKNNKSFMSLKYNNYNASNKNQNKYIKGGSKRA